MSKYVIISPLFVDLERKTTEDKRIYLNLNTYRNLHYLVNNQAKVEYKKIIAPQLGFVIDSPVDITYQVFKPTRRKLDKMNVVAVVSKYLLDAMTELGCWQDDNDDIVKTETILPTVYDKNAGRVEITIVKHERTSV